MKIKNLQLPERTIVGYCSECGGLLVVKEGMFGTFIGCDNFKNGCRNSFNYDKFEVDDDEYKILSVISDIDCDNFDEVLRIYNSDEYEKFSEELKIKIKEYLR